jgi:hypothetical protein
MYLPNPVSIGALKAIAYGGFGALVRLRSARAGGLLSFAAVRVLAGWIVGLIFFVALSALVAGDSLSDRKVMLAYAPLRFLVWAVLLHVWFRPKGGRAALLGWAAAGTVLSVCIDLVVFHFVNDVSWLRIAWC